MKLYLAIHSDGNITSSLQPIQEAGAEMQEKEVDDEVFEQIKAGTHQFKRGNTGRVYVKSTKIEEKQAEKEAARQTDLDERADLKAKIEAGTATDDDIKQALLKLL